MNPFVLPALMCLMGGVCQSAAPTDMYAITTTIKNRLINNAYPLQKELTSELRQQRKKADSTQLATCKKAQKAAQQTCQSAKKSAQAECNEQKKKLYASCKDEKAARRAQFKQVIQSLRDAKKQAHASAPTLRALLAQTNAYVEQLHTHAQAAEIPRLLRKAHAEQAWLNTLRSTLARSDFSLDAPLAKERHSPDRK